ncbi:MAG: 4Fe-4S dicluster domain-containing protein [Bacteriovoracaceae bacterium]|nr:4Fe-4S dicluster domain-containing protein [Bacteriovoracaceae bacterium]
MDPNDEKGLDYHFYKEIAKHPKGEGITKCLSCGTCSSTCQVLAVNNNYNPRKIIQKAVLGLREEVLNSEMIWICARCNSCIEKCPKGIRPGDIITAIRNVALEEGKTSNKGVRHSIYFKKSILQTGKVNEAILPLYTLRFKIFSQVPQAIKMFFKGKLPPIFPKKIKGIKDIRKLNQLIQNRKLKQAKDLNKRGQS